MIPVVFAQARFKKDTTAFKHKRYAKCNSSLPSHINRE